MDQVIVNWALGCAAAIGGWFMRVLWDADKELRADLSRLREELPKTYAEKADLERGFTRTFDKIDELREHFDKRMDIHESRYHGGSK